MNKLTIQTGFDQTSLESIKDFLCRIFGPNYHHAKSIKNIISKYEPSFKPDNFLSVITEKKELIGVVRIVERKLLVSGIPLDTGFISSVAVHPNWRNKGVASLLMETALKKMTERGMQISALYGRRAVDGFYLKFGYYSVGRYGDLEVISSTTNKHTFVLTEVTKEDLKKCAIFYKKTYRKLTGSIDRNAGIWNYLFNIAVASHGATRVKFVNKSQKKIGYVVMQENKLIEVSVPIHLYPEIPGLLRDEGIKFISIHPKHPLFRYLRSQYNTVYHERFALDGGYMAKILNYEKFFQKMMGVFKHRTIELGISDNHLGLFGYNLDLNKKELSKNKGRDDVIALVHASTILFLLGVKSLDECFGIKCSQKKQWIKLLFQNHFFSTCAFDEV